MDISDMDDVHTLGQANFGHILVKAVTGGPSAYALAGLTLVSVASLAFLESSLVLNMFMIGVALVVICSVVLVSLQGRGSAHDYDAQKSLPVVSDKPEQSTHTQSTLDVPGLVELKMPEPVAERAVTELQVVPLINDHAEKSDTTPIQVCTLRAKDSVECELNAAAAVMAEARPHAVVVPEHVANDNKKTQAKAVSTAVTAVVAVTDAKVMPSPLPKNVLMATPTEALAIKTIPVTKTEPTSSETAPKKNVQKKHKKPFSGEGVITFLYHTKMWGRIRLSERTKWGETTVFFHCSNVAGNTDIHQGQHVKVEYMYRRRNNKGKGNAGKLSACRVEATTPPPVTHSHQRWGPTTAALPAKWAPARTSPAKWAPTRASPSKWAPAPAPRQPQSWRARSMLRRSVSPPKHRASMPRSLVAKGPCASGGRGFQFRRTTVE